MSVGSGYARKTQPFGTRRLTPDEARRVDGDVDEPGGGRWLECTAEGFVEVHAEMGRRSRIASPALTQAPEPMRFVPLTNRKTIPPNLGFRSRETVAGGRGSRAS